MDTLTSCANVVKHFSLTKLNLTRDSCQAVSAHILAVSFGQPFFGTFYRVKSLSRVPMPTLLKASVWMFLSASLQMLRNAHEALLRSFHLGAFESVRTDALQTDWLASTLRPSLTGCLCGRFGSFLVVVLRTACTKMVRELAQHLQRRHS